MSGLQYQGGMNSQLFDVSQYGVGTANGGINAVSGLSGLASLIPGVGPLIGAVMNMLGTFMQNQQQGKFFNQYMSPAARMAQMKAAGINPAAAAQGISGAPAPQMNAAAPTGAFTGLGEQLGNSVNTALTASNIAADTKQKAAQAEGQDIQNKIAEVELGMKPSLLSAELDDLKESANQKRQVIEESKNEVDKIKAEKAKLEKEREYIIAEIGLVEYDKKVKEADTALKNAEAGLASANKELTDVNKKIAEKENENYLTPEQRITKEAEAKSKAEVENTPTGRLALQYEQEMENELKALDQKFAKKHDNLFNRNDYETAKRRIIRKYRNKIRRINKGGNAGITVAGSGVYAGG